MVLPADLRRGLARLNTPEKIQTAVDALAYNPDDSCRSALRAWREQTGHCLEGAFLAALALEGLGHRPCLLDLRAERDDDHVVALFRGRQGWGAVGKSNTTLLGYRPPLYPTLHALALSYWPFYFNTKGQMSLRAWAGPLALDGRAYRRWDWRTGEGDLIELGYALNDAPEKKFMTKSQLLKLPKAPARVLQACFLGSNPEGLYGA